MLNELQVIVTKSTQIIMDSGQYPAGDSRLLPELFTTVVDQFHLVVDCFNIMLRCIASRSVTSSAWWEPQFILTIFGFIAGFSLIFGILARFFLSASLWLAKGALILLRRMI